MERAEVGRRTAPPYQEVKQMDNQTLILIGGASVLGYMLLSGQQKQQQDQEQEPDMFGAIGVGGRNQSEDLQEGTKAISPPE